MKKIAVIGPESSGKSTLSKELAQAIDGHWVPEYARLYLEENGPDYDEKTVEVIGKGQLKLEAKAAEKAQDSWVVCDTDLMVIKVWMQYKYNSYPNWIDEKLDKNTLYLLCKPDMPWEPDPLRENPFDRLEIYSFYRNLLKKSGYQFIDLEGTVEERIEKSKSFISNFQ